MALQGHEEGITVHVETPVPAESYDLKILKIEKVEDSKNKATMLLFFIYQIR